MESFESLDCQNAACFVSVRRVRVAVKVMEEARSQDFVTFPSKISSALNPCGSRFSHLLKFVVCQLSVSAHSGDTPVCVKAIFRHYRAKVEPEGGVKEVINMSKDLTNLIRRLGAGMIRRLQYCFEKAPGWDTFDDLYC